MNILLVFSLFLGACLAAPEPASWPYRDSLHPYYYGYPGQTPYVYKASLEDDEEPSERSRQDSGVSVSSLIHSAAVKQQETINNYGRGTDRPTVIETGSAAPVQDQPGGDSSSNSKNKVSKAPAPNVIKPGLVNPPAFPPARRPAPPPQKKVKPTEEDEDEDDEDDEESPENEDEEEEVEVEDEEEEEEEDDDERRRNEPLEISSAPAQNNATSLESIEMPQGVNVSEPLKPVVLDETNEVMSSPPVKKGQQGKYPQENQNNESNEEGGFSSEGVEALVPGYVTDQGEVLVPVDTVTGDQPISIVPDPYTPPSRGVPLSYYGYNAAPGPVRSPGRFRQDEDGDDADYEFEDEDEEQDEEDDEDDDAEEEKVVVKKKEEKRKPPLGLIPATAPTNEDDEAENRFRAAVLDSFPPSRSPYLHPVTFRYNGGYLTGPFNNPVDSSEVFQYIQPNIRIRGGPGPGPGPSPYGYSSAEGQGQVIVRRRRPGPGPGPGPRPISVQAANVSPNNVFFAYTSQQRPQQQRRRPTVRIPVSQHIPVPSNYLYHAQRRNQYSPRPHPFYGQGYSQAYSQAYNQGYGSPYMMRRPYGGEPMYYPRPAPLHNPGEKLKIKSSYELLVEPHSDIIRVRTKKRPSNKNKNKKRVSSNKKKTTQQVKRRPVTIIGGPSPQRFVPASQQFQGQQQGQQQVLYRPFYNVQPHQRVPAQGYQSGPGPQGYQGYRQPAPYLSQAFQDYKEFVKGLAAGYYGSNTRRPTPVIMQDQPPNDTSASDSGADSSASSEIAAAASVEPIAPEERRPKMSSAAKKLNKVKLETNPDPLNILPRINKKTKTNRKSM